MKQEEAKALFIAAGFEVKGIKELPNGYWPDAYVEERKNSPWWFVKTEFGWIEIGRRKRVIAIDWKDLDISCGKITEDEVTQHECGIHAYSHAKVVEYLSIVRAVAIDEKQNGGVPEAPLEH